MLTRFVLLFHKRAFVVTCFWAKACRYFCAGTKVYSCLDDTSSDFGGARPQNTPRGAEPAYQVFLRASVTAIVIFVFIKANKVCYLSFLAMVAESTVIFQEALFGCYLEKDGGDCVIIIMSTEKNLQQNFKMNYQNNDVFDLRKHKPNFRRVIRKVTKDGI